MFASDADDTTWNIGRVAQPFSNLVVYRAGDADTSGVRRLLERNAAGVGGSLSPGLLDVFTEIAISNMIADRRNHVVVVARDRRKPEMPLCGVHFSTSFPKDADASDIELPVEKALVMNFPQATGFLTAGPTCVDETYRGQGLLQKMVGSCIDYWSRSTWLVDDESISKLDVPVVLTCVNKKNDASWRAHRKCGFIDMGEFDMGNTTWIAMSVKPRPSDSVDDVGESTT